MPALPQKEAKELIGKRHPEHSEHALRWRWLLDSLEGGERYRQAVYGTDTRAGWNFPVRNLVRHKREYPDPSSRQTNRGDVHISGSATGFAGAFDAMRDGQSVVDEGDDYTLRLTRTPVPNFVAEVVEGYAAKIYGGEIDREAPDGAQYDGLRAWWLDVDGLGTTADEWMSDTIAPLLLTLGQIDLCFDHPPAPTGSTIATEADAKRAGVKRCVATYVLPENMLDWVLEPDGSYRSCLYLEYADGSSAPLYRHWTDKDSTLYNADGDVKSNTPHRYGKVPIVRVFDRRKPRCRNVGQSRLDGVAEQQREYYNRDSELILSDTVQAHPLLQGPEDYVQADGTIPIGPSWLLPKKKHSSGGTVSYEGFETVDFPKGGAESLRQNKADIRESVDRQASLLKPAGSAGTGGSTVGQSGISKQFDHDALHAKLGKVAGALAKAERIAAMMALTVLTDGNPPKGAGDAEGVAVNYPSVFNLYAAEDLAQIAGDFQALLAASGGAPKTEAAILCEIARKALPGRDDDAYAEFDAEITDAIEARASAPEPTAAAPGATTPTGTAAGVGAAQPGAGEGDPMLDDSLEAVD